jgi:hypothetical protein
MYRQFSKPNWGSSLRSLAVAAALGVLVTSAGPAAAGLWPRGAVLRLDRCNQMSGCPDGLPDRMYSGKSVEISARRGPYAYVPVYPPEMPDYDNR